jgi:virulence-associated protein VapD
MLGGFLKEIWVNFKWSQGTVYIVEKLLANDHKMVNRQQQKLQHILFEGNMNKSRSEFLVYFLKKGVLS